MDLDLVLGGGLGLEMDERGDWWLWGVALSAHFSPEHWDISCF